MKNTSCPKGQENSDSEENGFGTANARDLSSGAKVRNGKVLGTHFAQPNGWPLLIVNYPFYNLILIN